MLKFFFYEGYEKRLKQFAFVGVNFSKIGQEMSCVLHWASGSTISLLFHFLTTL